MKLKASITPRGRLALRIMQLEGHADMDALIARVDDLEKVYGSAEQALTVYGEPTRSDGARST